MHSFQELRLQLYLLCLCLSVGIQAQTFTARYGTSSIDEGGSAVATGPNGDLFIGGFRGDSALIP